MTFYPKGTGQFEMCLDLTQRGGHALFLQSGVDKIEDLLLAIRERRRHDVYK
jgi:hypothetical protein